MLLSLIFSFRNEQLNIPELVRRAAAACDLVADMKYELIFVNDASNDGSLELLIELKKNYPITIINMSRRFGVTPCVLAGMAYAKGDALIYMDSDLQDPPEIIPEMVEKYINGADVVHTTRTQREGEGLFKLWATKRAYSVINFFSDINLPENTGDFKLLSSRVVKKILELKEYDPYMRGLSVWVGFTQEFVFYKREPRFKGKTKFPVFSRGPLNEFVRGLTAYSAAPLYFSLFLGMAVTFIAVLLITWAIITKMLGVSVPGISSVIVALSFFSGASLITNGFIGIYVAKIYYEVKGRPRYIVSNVIEHEK
jgi:glycosyltransferase involved in cell wall biosynthesis